jgi:hypothetical protein
MPEQEVFDLIGKYVAPYRITKGKGFRLKDFDPGDTCGLQLDKGEATDLPHGGSAWLAEEQDMLYAQDRWSLLLVFQARHRSTHRGSWCLPTTSGSAGSSSPGAIVEAMARLDLAYPKLDAVKKKDLAAVRVALSRER